jgi:DNA excision repair protein ERCC-2
MTSESSITPAPFGGHPQLALSRQAASLIEPNLIGGPFGRRLSVTDADFVRAPNFLAHDKLRPGQDEMIEAAHAAIADSGSHLAAAPTGIGKTAAALSAALDAAESSPHRRIIFFLTGRHAQHRIVVETVRDINSRRPSTQRKIGLVDLVGQQSMCIDEIRFEFSSLFSRLCAEKRSNRKCMPYLQEAEGLRLKVLEDPLHVSELVEVARKYTQGGRAKPTCPWKVARETASSADVVVCDYNHLFHDRVREASLEAMGIDLGEVILIVDEAHNLPNRITQGMKRVLTSDLILSARLELEEYVETLEEESDDPANDGTRRMRRALAALERIRTDILAWMRVQSQALVRQKSEESRVPNSELLEVVASALKADLEATPLRLEEIAAILAEVRIELDPDLDDEKESASERLSELFHLLQRLGESSALALVFSHGVGDSPKVTTHLLDPGIVSGPIFDAVAGSLLMSGTLTPPEMYGELLGLPKEKPLTMREYPSPFLSDKRPVAAATGVTSQFNRRGEGNTKRIRQHIHTLLQETPGHVAVFAPSYALLNEIIGEEVWHGRRVLLEEPGWSKNLIDSLLRDMEMARSAGERILLAGVFSAKLAEGIDYERNLLDAVVCIGLPLAPPSEELNARKEYYEDRFGRERSYRWAVLQPAVNSVMQAMGRPIRKMGDRAFILLLEDRLLQPRYNRLLPENLTLLTCPDPQTTRRHVKRFFQRHPNPAVGTD